MRRIRFHGRGGQGMKTASRILGSAAFQAGWIVQDSPIYGAERRGAPMAAFTRIAHDPILERGAIATPDLVVVADDTLLTEPAAQPLAGCDSACAILLNSYHDANDIPALANHHGRILTADFTTLALKQTQTLVSLSTAHDQFGRYYGLVEPFQLDDAEYVLVISNAFTTKGKAAVQRLRTRGVKAGLLRLRVLRPFPAAHIADALEGRKAVAVIDQNLAPGLGGITYQEIATALYGRATPPPLLSVIGGLGGKDISAAEFDAVFHDLERVAAGEWVESPRLLYTQPEQDRMQTLLQIAGKEIVA